MMRRGGLLVALVLVGAAFAGCIGTDGDGTVERNEAPAPGEPERSTETRTLEGTATSVQPQTHELDIGEEIRRFNATLTDVDATAPGGATLYLYGPDDDLIDSGTHVTLQGVHIETYGTGTYELTVAATVTAGEASYEVEANVVEGPQRPAIDPEPVNVTEPEDPGTVVALIDTGINPYHEVFQREPAAAPDVLDQATGEPVREVPLTAKGDHEHALAADDPAWRGLERQTLYRFDGTNVYGISLVPEDGASGDAYPVLDESGHGTATAHSVLREAPDATVVMVEVTATSWSEIADAIEWTAQQDWIDVVSASLGNIGNAPNPLIAGGDPDNEVPQASKAVHESGKLYVNSAGNDPSFHYTDNSDGPPWVIAVSGAEPSTKGRDILPANGPDLVANFTVNAATHDSTDGYAWTQGTSFSAPSAAGSLANAILEVRETLDAPVAPDGEALVDADGVTVTNDDVREAFNRSAVYWDTTGYDPTDQPTNDTARNALAASAPVLPAPWVQTGWGYVNASVAEDAAAHLLGDELDEKPAPAQAHMDAQQELRGTYWSAQLSG